MEAETAAPLAQPRSALPFQGEEQPAYAARAETVAPFLLPKPALPFQRQKQPEAATAAPFLLPKPALPFVEPPPAVEPGPMRMPKKGR